MTVQNAKTESITISPRQILKTVYTPFEQYKNRGELTTYQIVASISLRGPGKSFGRGNLNRVTQVNLIPVAQQSSTGIYIYGDTDRTFTNFPVSAYKSSSAEIPVEEPWIVVSGHAVPDLVIGTIKRFTISTSGAPKEIQEELKRRL